MTVKCLSAMWETKVWPLGWEDPLEKEMATHSSTLAWKLPWTEEPGRLPSIRSQKGGQHWATSLSADSVFHGAEVLILLKSNLLVFFFHGSCLWPLSKKLAPYPRSSRFSSRLSSRKFIVLHFACSFIIYFELNFVKGVTFVSISIFLFLLQLFQ